MRTTTITAGSETLSVEYPNEEVFLKDNIFFKFTEDNGNRIKATIKVYDNSTPPNLLKTLEYESSTPQLVFRVHEVLKEFSTGQVTTFNIEYEVEYHNGTTFVTFSAQTDKYVAINGKTLARRPHGSERVIVYNDSSDLTGIEVYCPYNTTSISYYVGGLNYIDFSKNIHTIASTIDDKQIKCSKAFSPYTQLPFHNVWNREYEYKYYIKLKNVCPRENGLKVYYYNTDGCKRMVIGEVVSDKNTVKRDEYSLLVDEVKRRPYAHHNSIEDVFTLFVQDVEPLQYLEDIMISDEWWINVDGDDIPIVLVDTEVTTNGEIEDYKLTFKIQR